MHAYLWDNQRHTGKFRHKLLLQRWKKCMQHVAEIHDGMTCALEVLIGRLGEGVLERERERERERSERE